MEYHSGTVGLFPAPAECFVAGTAAQPDRPHNRKKIGKDRINMLPVDEITFDNAIFRYLRKIVFALDNALFNHKGSAGPKYQATRYVLVLPFFSSIAGAVFVLFSNIFVDLTEDDYIHILTYCLLILLVVNLILMSGNIFVFRSRAKKLLYPVFIAAITLIFSFFFFSIFLWGWCFWFIVLIIWDILTGGGGPSTIKPRSISSYYEQPEPYYEEAHIDDGTFGGRKLTRNSRFGDWKDGMGHTYSESFGQFKRKD